MMIKKILLSLLISLLTTSFLISQESDSITAEKVIQDYIEAIGGEAKIDQIKSLEMIGKQTFQGQEHILTKSVIKNCCLQLKRALDEIEMKAIVSDSLGINITPDGTFKMPPDQLMDYLEETSIIPETEYLKKGYPLKYYGIYELNGDIKCHEIGIRLPDGSMIYREYNTETGLLELTTQKKAKIRVLDYVEKNGVLFPSKYIQNGTTYEMQSIVVNPELSKEKFEWNTERAKELIGRWEATMPENDGGQQQVNFFELQADRSGKNGIGIIENGALTESPFLTFNIVGWQIEEPNVKLLYYDPANRKLNTQYLIIKDLQADHITGYIEDPELSEQFGNNFQPIILEYHKVKN